MPYITPERRSDLDIRCNCYTDCAHYPETAGELNYVVTQILNTYLSNRGLSYQTLNDIIGMLEGAKLELYRRVVAPYEDKKIEINGDVYNRIARGA